MKLPNKIVTLGETSFEGWGVKFKLKDLDWKTIVGLSMVLAAVVYVIKG